MKEYNFDEINQSTANLAKDSLKNNENPPVDELKDNLGERTM